MKKIHITRLAIATGIASAIAIASAASAADKQSAHITDPASLPKFANVQVVNRIPTDDAATAAQAKLPQSSLGMRAYIDADSKKLRAANPEELAAAAAPTAKASFAAPAAKRSAAALTSDAPAARQLPNGATVLTLDESSMSFSVARVAADGSVKEDCVQGKERAEATLKVAATPGVDTHEK